MFSTVVRNSSSVSRSFSAHSVPDGSSPVILHKTPESRRGSATVRAPQSEPGSCRVPGSANARPRQRRRRSTLASLRQPIQQAVSRHELRPAGRGGRGSQLFTVDELDRSRYAPAPHGTVVPAVRRLGGKATEMRTSGTKTRYPGVFRIDDMSYRIRAVGTDPRTGKREVERVPEGVTAPEAAKQRVELQAEIKQGTSAATATTSHRGGGNHRAVHAARAAAHVQRHAEACAGGPGDREGAHRLRDRADEGALQRRGLDEKRLAVASVLRLLPGKKVRTTLRTPARRRATPRRRKLRTSRT